MNERLKVLRLLFYSIVSLMFLPDIYATHNRAGEIIVEQTGDCNDLTVKATIVTYTKASSAAADRDSLTICWGDGTCQVIARTNGPKGGLNGVPQGQFIGNDTKKNLYVAVHTYPGRATYVISMTDPNRNGGILNVNPPASDVVPFHIQTTYTFLNSQFQGCNSTPVLLKSPIDFACVGQPFKHNPSAFDIDKDSLSYHLIVPLQGVGSPVPNYFFPHQIKPGVNNNITLNPKTGDLIWNSPQLEGEYNIAMIIVEYRQGVAIDTMVRDMQIFVQTCDNKPPDIMAPSELCVLAGEKIAFDVTATDPDVPFIQKVKLSAVGGPFVVSKSPATFTVAAGHVDQPNIGKFEWQTACEHISEQVYSLIFTAEDNYLSPTSGFTNLKTVLIKVVGPPPLNLNADSQNDVVKLTWDDPYACDEIDDNYFFGFSVWRREGSNPFVPDSCETGLAGKGYTRIAFKQKAADAGKYLYEDKNVEPGRNYCYRIVAEFAKLSAGGNPYNIVESIPSKEACIQVNRDVPLMTNVSISTTSNTAGVIEVRWSKPSATDLDTLKYPGPYRYQLLRAEGLSGGSFVEIPEANFIKNQFWQANDTIFTDNNPLNTLQQAYSYKVIFYADATGNPVGTTQPASSVFHSVASSDKLNVLSWQANVPWQNYRTTIYRLNDITGLFDSIASVTDAEYTDTKLVNGKEYCYKVKTSGTYGIGGIASPLYNFSQEVCGTPLDTVPPCAPQLTVSNPCAENNPELPEDLFNNLLTWNTSPQGCQNQNDAVEFKIYFKGPTDDTFELIETLPNNGVYQYSHKPKTGIAGCYYVTAVDSVGNESHAGYTVCVDNCPVYILPNTFTPNNDGQNDIYHPRISRFVERIDMKIYDRWGVLVFETTHPEINWSGTDMQGKDLAEGVYYYICTYFVNGQPTIIVKQNVLNGFIHLIKGQ